MVESLNFFSGGKTKLVFYLSKVLSEKMKQDDLQKQLRGWKIDVPDDPHFRSSVWREISIRERASPLDWLSETADRLIRPRLAVPTAIAAALAVLAAASIHGMQNRERAWEKLALSYKSSIDPIAQTERHSLRNGNLPTPNTP